MEQQNGITTHGTGSVHIPPDIARLSIGVSVLARDATKARTSAATAIAGVIAALIAQGVSDRDLRTGQLTLAVEYDYTDGKQKARRYRATNDIQVTVRDVALAGEVVDAAVSAGSDHTRLHGLSFEIEDSALLRLRALESAYADARARAETLAKAAGVSLGSPVRIEEVVGDHQVPVVARMAIFPETAPTPIKAGEQEVSATIVATWAIG